MTTITWQIEYMNVSSQPIDGETEVVLTAGWRCIASETVPISNPIEGGPTENMYTSSNCGVCSFPNPAVGGQFTPYSQLTQSQVLDWCYENGVDQIETETSVTQAVNNLVNPSIVSPALPWVTPIQEGA
jgi:hypothetical protein